MTTAQIVETSVTVTNGSLQNYTHPDDHTRHKLKVKCTTMKSIASYSVVFKQRDNVLSFFPVNSEIIFCMFSFFYAHVLQINPLLPFFNIFSGTHVRPCVQVATPLVFHRNFQLTVKILLWYTFTF